MGSRLDIARILEKNPVAMVMGPMVENPAMQGATVVVHRSIHNGGLHLGQITHLGVGCLNGLLHAHIQTKGGPGSSTIEIATTTQRS